VAAALSRRAWLLLGGLVAVGLLLRLASYDDALYGDELSTYFVVHGHSLSRMMAIIHSDQEQTPPLYFVLAWLSAKLGGGAQTLRLPSMVGGLAAIPLVYALGARTVGRLAGLLAAALVALSPFLIFYSTEARSYAVLMFLALASTYALVCALQTGRRRWWALYAVASCAAMYTHYTGLFVLVAQALWALWAHREAWRALLIANGAAAVGYIPWLGGYSQDANSPGARVIEAIHPFGAGTAARDFGHLALGAPFVGLRALPGAWALALIGAGLAIAAAVVVARGGRRPSPQLALVIVAAAAVPLGAGAASIIGPSVYLSRNLITAAPFLALVAGALLSAPRGLVRAVAASLVVGGCAVGAAMTLDAGNQRPDYNALADYVQRTGRPGDPVAEVSVVFAGPAILQSLEVAMADKGLTSVHPVLRVGLPSIAADRRRREPPGPGQFAPIAIPSPVALAHRADLLSSNGTLFVALQGGVTTSLLRRLPSNPETRFLAALPKRLHLVRKVTFPGLNGGAPLLVYSSSAIRGASRLRIHTESAQIAAKSATDTARRPAPPAAAGLGAAGSMTHLRASSNSGVSGLSAITSRMIPGTRSIGYSTGVP
jgi:mannosyltransferase